MSEGSPFGLSIGDDDELLGRVIAGKYALRALVGAGSSGTVYKADQTSLGRTVAVKVLRRDLASDPRFIRRFNDEALAASRLNHPNVVSVIDFGQTEDGLLYLVMEYLRGPTLNYVLQSEELPTARIVDLLSQVLSALEEAQDVGVVHADLKADNIVIERRRRGWDLVKVVDFGIARLVGRADQEGEERTICGTPEYMAPEVIRGEEPGFHSDIYAAGILLYEMMTGVTPFAGGDSMEVLRRQLESRVPTISEITERKLDPGLFDIALRALAKEPARRFASAAEFRDALEVLLRSEGTTPGEVVLCGACGTVSPISFKFCPECGCARPAAAPDRGGDPLELDLDSAETADFPQRVVTAADLAARITQEDAAGILPLPLVGREAELAQLASFLRSEDPGTLQLVGPIGSGRSRLFREACARVAESGVVIYLANPDPTGLSCAYYPIRSAVAGVLGLPALCSYDEIGAALDDIGLSRRDQPGIGELFGHGGGLSTLEAEVRKRELEASVLRVLRAAGRDPDAVVAFEDAEEFDRPSIELLRRLVELNEERPTFKLLISSSEGGDVPLPPARRVELPPLGDEAVRALVAHFASRGHPDLVTAEELRVHGHGLPGRVHHIVRYCVEGGALPAASTSLADLIAGRLDALPLSARQVIQAAAVLGNEAEISDLEALLASDLKSDAIEEALELLGARELVRVEDTVWIFTAPVVRNVSYDAIPVSARRDLHARALELLSARIADPAVLGHHAQLSGELDRGAELLGRAGDSALRYLDHGGACALYNRALVAAREHVLAGGGNGARLRFVNISIRLADALRRGGESSLARGVIEEARAHADAVPVLRAQLVRSTAHLTADGGDTEGAIASLREAIGAVIPHGATDLLCELYLDLAAMLLRAGQLDVASQELSEAIDLITAGEGGAAATGPRGLWRLLLRLAQLYAADGKARQAIPLAEHAHRHANNAHSGIGAARAQAFLAGQFELVGNQAKASVYRRRAVDGMRTLGDRRGTAELLLSAVRASRTVGPVTPSGLREARLLAEEVGWTEGVRRARRASETPRPDEP